MSCGVFFVAMMAAHCASSMRYEYIDIGRHATTMKVRVNFLDMRQRHIGYIICGVTVRSEDSWYSLLFSDRRERWKRIRKEALRKGRKDNLGILE